MLPLRFIAPILLVTEASHHRNIVNAFWHPAGHEAARSSHGRQFARVTDRCVTMRLNLKILISGDTFDDPPFFYQQLKFTWLVGIGIAFELGGMSMRPVGTQSRFTIPLNLFLFLPLARLVI